MARRGRPIGARTTQAEVVEAIQALAALGFSAAEIERTLGDLAPPGRTTRDIARAQNEDRSGAWSPVEPDVTIRDAHLVLDVLRAVVEASGGRRTFLTRNEAEKIDQLAAVAPDLPPMMIWRLARLYLQRAQDKQSTEDCDVYLAFAPWQSENAARAYAQLLEGGRAVAAPSYLSGTPKGDRDYSNPSNVRRRMAEIADWLKTDSPLEGE